MVKTGSESSPQAALLAREADVDRQVFKILNEHYQLARRVMEPEGALATAYGAAQNFLASQKKANTGG